MTQLDEQLEEIGLECLTARWLADFLEIPRGRVYRVVQLIGAEPIGHTGRAAIYDADTIIGLASFLYGQGRFSSHTGRLPKGGLERLKRHLDYLEDQASPTEPDGLLRHESPMWQALATAAKESELPPNVPAFTVLSVLQGAAWQAGEEYPALKGHLARGMDQFAYRLGFDDGAWERFEELLREVAPVAASPALDLSRAQAIRVPGSEHARKAPRAGGPGRCDRLSDRVTGR